MTYDPDRRMVLMFGGETTTGSLSATLLAWNGTNWTCIAAGGPPPRSATMLAYDAARHVVVLYGGRAGRAMLRDTWEFSAAGWRLVNDSGPTNEPHGVIAYDSASRAIVMFNGLGDDGPARATWSWNGREWAKRADAPTAEFPNAMFASDGSHGAVLITARRGEPGREFTPPVYEWRASAWTPVSVTGEAPTFSPQAPAAGTASSAVLYAGFEKDQSVTTWILDKSHWRRHDGLSPPRRKGAQMVFDPARSVMVLHGGDDGSRVLDDTWEWNGSSWRKVR